MEVRKRTICQAIFCGDIPWNLGLKNRPNIYAIGTSNQSISEMGIDWWLIPGLYSQIIRGYTSWWFGIMDFLMIFHSVVNVIIPTDKLIFFRDYTLLTQVSRPWCQQPHGRCRFLGGVFGILMFYQAQLEACCCCRQFAYLGRKRLFVSIPSWCDGGINQEIPCKGSSGHVRRRACYSLTIEPVTV